MTFRDTATVFEAVTSHNRLYLGEDKDSIIYLGYPLRLTNKEYVILKTVAHNVGTPISASDISAMTDMELSEQNVVYHISGINRKSKAIGKRPLIKNISKIGYFLNEEM